MLMICRRTGKSWKCRAEVKCDCDTLEWPTKGLQKKGHRSPSSLRHGPPAPGHVLLNKNFKTIAKREKVPQSHPWNKENKVWEFRYEWVFLMNTTKWKLSGLRSHDLIETETMLFLPSPPDTASTIPEPHSTSSSPRLAPPSAPWPPGHHSPLPCPHATQLLGWVTSLLAVQLVLSAALRSDVCALARPRSNLPPSTQYLAHDTQLSISSHRHIVWLVPTPTLLSARHMNKSFLGIWQTPLWAVFLLLIPH